MSLDFLLEIGTEEIPHWMIPSALEQLAKLDLLGAKPEVDATPRRLVVRATGLPERTPDAEQVVKGPPITSGDKAAEGFAKKQGADASALRKAGNYYELVKKIAGRETKDILAESIPAAIIALQWPKTMYWTGKGGVRFIRPIRWLVAMLGSEVIPFEIAGVKTGNLSRGHRRLGATFSVDPKTYEADLRKQFVILSSAERRSKIVREAQALGAKIDPELLETLTFITEYPTAIKGDFDPAYLALPAEVLTTVMRHHQKYFSVEASPVLSGATVPSVSTDFEVTIPVEDVVPKPTLAPHFVAIMNTSGDPEGLVKRGNENVLRARFNDARFFFNVDQQKKLVDRVNDLANVTFQAKLGSYKEKTERVIALVKELGGDADAQRAALLAKCDLTTDMVKEFTDLQGIVGGLYARHQGESESAAQAIYEHYKPLSMEDSIPASEAGRILALADKLDTLRGCFAVGLIPSGSKDPFALRRAAQGVVKIFVEAKLNYKLDQLAQGDLRAFLLERIQYYFRDIRGYKYDEVNAVAASGVSTLADMEARLAALSAVRPTQDFEPLAASFKRINNILKQADGFVPSPSVDPSLFQAMGEIGPEKDLYDALKRVQSATRGKSYKVRLEGAASLRPHVDTLFNNTMVNAPDLTVRANRLTLLHQLLTEFSTIADFSEIVTSGDQK